ncbi:MAG: stage III sporulation protein AF [Clostridia bacterium]|jgi:hypothetical protein|nr:stage III sporulation protein AF [Clostridia bacterium]MCI2000940.1 stage III sporulation protein AF [Clostridia bacterium]MCI2015724.1 stage III sporulation protein AF [Clostridia bacterium]
MISAIEAYIKNIAVFMILSVAAGIAAPEKYKKYVDFACGLILVLAAAGPLMSLSKTDCSKYFDESYYTNFQEENNSVDTEKFFKSTAENRICADIQSELALMGLDCENVSVKTDDDFYNNGVIDSIEVKINGSTKMDVVSYLKDRYGAKNVEVIHG